MLQYEFQHVWYTTIYSNWRVGRVACSTLYELSCTWKRVVVYKARDAVHTTAQYGYFREQARSVGALQHHPTSMP